MSPSPAVALVDSDGTLLRADDRGPVAWWSLTKTAIAALALRLADLGRLDLDAAELGTPYTLRQLLRHTAGLPDYGALPEYQAAVEAGETPWSDGELFRRADAGRLLFRPGEGWRYSNIGTLLARRRLEQSTGLALGEALLRHVLEPLGISGTRLAETADDMARLLHPPPHPYSPGWVFHGTLIGPVSGTALFVHRLLLSDFLSPPSRAALLAFRPVDRALAREPWSEPGYGTGTMLGRWADGTERSAAAGHSAGGPGSEGAAYRLVAAGRSVTVSVFAPPGEVPVETVAWRIALPFLTS